MHNFLFLPIIDNSYSQKNTVTEPILISILNINVINIYLTMSDNKSHTSTGITDEVSYKIDGINLPS